MQDRNAPPLPAATRRQLMIGAAAASAGLALGTSTARADMADGIARNAAAIHQEPIFQASRHRIYAVLTEPRQFDRVVALSAARQAMAIGSKPSAIGSTAGSAFTLFGGYITGRQLELVPGTRIVQAWRTQSWSEGAWSIARFELTEEGAGTRILFDHRGFPDDQADHLAAGWQANYWQPLEKYLARQK